MQVRVDGGDWAEAELSPTPARRARGGSGAGSGTPTPGSHELEVRAVDEAGDVQLEEPAAPAPDGAQGYDRVTVDVQG